MTDKKELGNKVWFRILKVLYVVSILGLILFVSTLVVKKHYQNVGEGNKVDYDKSYVQCGDGVKKDLTSSLYARYILDGGFGDSKTSKQEVLSKLCDHIIRVGDKEYVFEKKNEAMIVYKKMEWFKIFSEILIYSIAGLLVIEFIKRAIYYILFGRLKI